MDHQAALGTKGAPFTITHRGTTYPVRFNTLRMKAQLEKWAKEKAVRDLVALKSVLPKEDYDAQMTLLIKELRGEGRKKGEKGPRPYEYGGEQFLRLMDSDEGGLEHLRALLGKTSTEVPDALAGEILEEKGDEIFAFVSACQADVERIKLGLGWDQEKDPEGDKLDPKALRAAMQAAGYLE